MPDLTADERRAIDSLASIHEPPRLRQLIANARRNGSVAVERAAFARLCSLLPQHKAGTLQFDVWQSIHALEEMLKQERSKTVRLSRTRQKIARDGEAKTAADLTLKQTASSGFNDLIARDMPELTFEAVVLRHPIYFDALVLEAARARLAQAGVKIDHSPRAGEES